MAVVFILNEDQTGVSVACRWDRSDRVWTPSGMMMT
jgi:hypothetical protein